MQRIETHGGTRTMVLFHTLDEVEAMTREGLIAWLMSNDRNGCYSDADNLAEWGAALPLASLVESAWQDGNVFAAGEPTTQAEYWRAVTALASSAALMESDNEWIDSMVRDMPPTAAEDVGRLADSYTFSNVLDEVASRTGLTS